MNAGPSNGDRAAGLMQLMPETALRYLVPDRFDPAMNLEGGARYLRYLLGMFGGDLSPALAACNADQHAVLRSGTRKRAADDSDAVVGGGRADAIVPAASGE